MRGKIGVGVMANYFAALVISSITSKCIFLEILGCCCCIRDLTGRGDDEGSLLAQELSWRSRRAHSSRAELQRVEGQEERPLKLS